MRHFPYLILFTFLLCGCASNRRLIESVHQQDSVMVEVHTKTEYIKDTVYLEIPAQTAERTTSDSTSHLENDYAASNARINPDGTLYHDLNTKPQKKPFETETPVERKDSIVYKYKDRTVYETIEVEVERELSWWEKTQMYGFWVAFVFLIITYRKVIFSFVKRLL